MTSTVVIDPQDLVDPVRWAERGYPHELWARMRAEDPIAWVEPDGYEPFWAVARHAHVQEVARQPTVFCSSRGIQLRRQGAPVFETDVLVLLDPPRHGPMRRIVNSAFTPRAVRALQGQIEALAGERLDEALAEPAGELDFVDAIAAPFPLAVIASRVGVAREDIPRLHQWTNEVIGKNDPEYQRPGETAGQTIRRARGELHAYIRDLVEQRRRRPEDDLLSELITAEVEGRPLTEDELIAYGELFVEAGNETTRNAISGGLIALLDHPGEMEKLRADPELLPDAVEEMLRWVSPISHFARTATQAAEVGGQRIAAGQEVAIYFASANRDEDVFEDAGRFRVDRRPNPHLAFGFGEHFCLGAHLARVEMEVLFRLLLERVATFEICGPVERLQSITNGSIKHLPVRYQLA